MSEVRPLRETAEILYSKSECMLIEWVEEQRSTGGGGGASAVFISDASIIFQMELHLQ